MCARVVEAHPCCLSVPKIEISELNFFLMNLRSILQLIQQLVSNDINPCILYLILWRDVLNDDVLFQLPRKLDILIRKDGIKLF